LAASSNLRLRVGVVGLGKLWEGRHKAALARMADRFRVTAIYDQVALRAALEARELHCAAPQGLAATVERPDVDVVYLLNPQWFGLHAAVLAAAAGKPVYCALPVGAYPEELEALAANRGAEAAPFVPELARRFYPATLRLRELMATRLGPPRRIVGHARFFGYDRYGPPGPATQSAPLPMAVDPAGNLLDWCRFVMQAEPRTIQAFGSTALVTEGAPEATEDHGGFLLEFPAGAVALVTFERFHRTPWGDSTRYLPPPGFQVYCERGAAWLEIPDRICWTDAEGSHEEALPIEPTIGEVLNDQLHRLLRGEPSLSPSFHDALSACRLVQALLKSRSEGRKIDLLDPAGLSRGAADLTSEPERGS
jgi:predicted dehydrogenase